MHLEETISKKYLFKPADWAQNGGFLSEYLKTLAYPMDSYMEDHLEQSEIFSVYASDLHIGFAVKEKETLWFFYLQKPWIRYSQDVFTQFIEEQQIKSVFFQTSDTLLANLVCDWEFEKEKGGYFFIDSGRQERPSGFSRKATFRLAGEADIALICEETGNFFDNLEKRVERETIFMLLHSDILLGCGIVVYGRYFKQNAGIGMITCKKHRKKGVGQTVLQHLKELCYCQGLTPVTGCWYYNTLSRKTLEKAGMVSSPGA